MSGPPAPVEHGAAWPMLAPDPRTATMGAQGRCQCRWRGLWRATWAEAVADIDAHLARAGVEPAGVTREPPKV